MRTRHNVGKRTLLAKTCIKCGEFKDARFFQVQKAGYRNSWCRQCCRKLTQPRTINRNLQTVRTATERYKPWDVPEINKLQRLIDQGLPYKEIAPLMGRTISAITAARHTHLRD